MDKENLNICKLCNINFKEDSSFNRHLYGKHKVNVQEYFCQHYPRFDLLTNERILFKTRQQYFETDFVSKENLNMWLKTINPEKAKEYCKSFLINRKHNKNLIYAPSHVELRTLMAPTISTFNKLFGSYSKVCEEIGLKNRFLDIEIPKLINLSSEKIIIDSREQIPLQFKNSEVRGLKFGDYFANGFVYIEKKSLTDLVGTLSKGFERFQREIQKSKEAGAQLVIVVLENFINFLDFNRFYPVLKRTRIEPVFIAHRIREIMQKFDNCQFLFLDKERVLDVCEKLLLGDFDFSKVDLQLKYDRGEI